jgi:hypothetical protein
VNLIEVDGDAVLSRQRKCVMDERPSTWWLPSVMDESLPLQWVSARQKRSSRKLSTTHYKVCTLDNEARVLSKTMGY